jgi:flagellar biosynthesis protein FlhG
MIDQAAELRQLMQTLSQRSREPAVRPRTIAVAGSSRGAGTTTIAVNLAVELVRHGRRVVLVDAEPSGDATRLCRLHEPGAMHRSGFAGASVADVFLGRRKIGEAICRAAHGLRVVGNPAGPTRGLIPTGEEIAVLSAEIVTLGQEADVVLLDAGCGDAGLAQGLFQEVDTVLLISGDTDTAIMETYASIKRIAATAARPNLCVLFSRVDAAGAADDAFARLAQGCQRFLGLMIEYAGCVCEDKTVADAATCAAPFIVLSPRCEAARGLQQASEHLMGMLSLQVQRGAQGPQHGFAAAPEAQALVAISEAA